MNSLENLKIWKKALELATQVYEMTFNLPKDEQYGLIAQMRRSAVSIASNVAEGAGRNSNKEFKHFLSMAHGSSYELQTQLEIVKNLNLINKEITEQLKERISEIQKMNYKLQSKL